jgi:hypothetical protein
MTKRFLTATPRELLSFSGRELIESIRISEGRVLCVSARSRAANLIDYVCNAEVAAAFGADLIQLDTYEVDRPMMPGLPSKNIAEDQQFSEVQIRRGLGYSLKEIRELIGRPVGVLLFVTEPEGEQGIITSYGNVLATGEVARKAIESGANFLSIGGWASPETTLTALRSIRAAVGPDPIIEFIRPHGTGLMNFGVQGDLITEGEALSLLEAGADIIGMPAPATFPGWTVEKCGAIVNAIHRVGKLASLGVHTSQEGSNTQTLEQIALLSKMAGADIHELGDSGYNEAMIPPENIMAFGVALRGRRHHYRRMAFSPLQ